MTLITIFLSMFIGGVTIAFASLMYYFIYIRWTEGETMFAKILYTGVLVPFGIGGTGLLLSAMAMLWGLVS